ncbi:MAG: OmpA family protein [Desulfosarcinaceae bacterium]|nr:OmpA family protein [Desulfosarcinaceae bacterium]
MRSYLATTLIFILWVGTSAATAEELTFPQTTAEIYDALQFKPGPVAVDDMTYEIEKNNVYRIINGKRFRLRGLKIIETKGLAPRAGAMIHFDTDSATIKPVSTVLLDKFGKVLANDIKEATIVIAGHADSRGTHTYNQSLSEKRARAVSAYLISNFQIAPERILSKGYGETRPLANNDTDEGKSKNRRVEFIRIH